MFTKNDETLSVKTVEGMEIKIAFKDGEPWFVDLDNMDIEFEPYDDNLHAIRVVIKNKMYRLSELVTMAAINYPLFEKEEQEDADAWDDLKAECRSWL